MPLVKKINDSWQPAENPNLKIGEVVELTNVEALVKNGLAVLVDESGNELELPGQFFNCPICFTKTEGASGLMEHLSVHLKNNKKVMEDQIKTLETVVETIPETVVEEVKEEITTPEVKELTPEEKLKQTRAAALEKARAARQKKAESKIKPL